MGRLQKLVGMAQGRCCVWGWGATVSPESFAQGHPGMCSGTHVTPHDVAGTPVPPQDVLKDPHPTQGWPWGFSHHLGMYSGTSVSPEMGLGTPVSPRHVLREPCATQGCARRPLCHPASDRDLCATQGCNWDTSTNQEHAWGPPMPPRDALRDPCAVQGLAPPVPPCPRCPHTHCTLGWGGWGLSSAWYL